MRIFLSGMLFLLMSLQSQAQVYYKSGEFGFTAGAAGYFGDLNQEYKFNYLRESGGVFYKHNFGAYIALGLHLNFSNIGFSDKYSSNYYQQLRNLDFKSNIYEAAIKADFHFFRFEVGSFDYRLTPYVSLGFGLMNYNPYTEYDGKKYYLRPLGTEGQNFPAFADRKYSSTAMTIPIGAGVKFWMAKGITVGMEISHRQTSTDYLDDVSATYVGKSFFPDDPTSPYPTPASQLQDRSVELGVDPIGIAGRQRGMSSTKDQFFTGQVFISFRIPTYRCPTVK